MPGTRGDAGAKAAPGTRGDAARAQAKRPCSDAEEDGQRLRVVSMDDGEEDEGIEEQMHRDRIGQRLRASEDERLGKGEGDGQQRPDRTVAELPQERQDEDQFIIATVPLQLEEQSHLSRQAVDRPPMQLDPITQELSGKDDTRAEADVLQPSPLETFPRSPVAAPEHERAVG